MAINPVQMSYSQNPQEAVIGAFAEAFGPRRVKTRFSRGLSKAGYGCFLTAGASNDPLFIADPGEVFQTPFPSSAALVGGVHSGASSASIQNITTFNGAYGAAGVTLQPARQLTFAWNGSGDWDPTNASFTYVNERGATVTETIAVATSTNATTVGRVKRPVSLTIPAQTGAGGTFTIDIALLAAATEATFEGVCVRQEFKRTVNSAQLYSYPGQGSLVGTGDYVDGDAMPVMCEGGIWVYSETAVADGDPVYVRVTANGGFLDLGAFANAAGTGRVLLSRARFVRDSSGPGPAWARFLYL